MSDNKLKAKTWFSNWVRNNIFGTKKADALLYFFFYIAIPIIVTPLGLSTTKNQGLATAYCYLTILISLLCCLYDAINRWKSKRKTIINSKLFIMCIPIVLLTVYCIFEIAYYFSLSSFYSFDNIFYIYLVTMVMSLIDIVSCFANELAFNMSISKSTKQGSQK